MGAGLRAVSLILRLLRAGPQSWFHVLRNVITSPMSHGGHDFFADTALAGKAQTQIHLQ